MAELRCLVVGDVESCPPGMSQTEKLSVYVPMRPSQSRFSQHCIPFSRRCSRTWFRTSATDLAHFNSRRRSGKLFRHRLLISRCGNRRGAVGIKGRAWGSPAHSLGASCFVHSSPHSSSHSLSLRFASLRFASLHSISLHFASLLCAIDVLPPPLRFRFNLRFNFRLRFDFHFNFFPPTLQHVPTTN